MRALRSHPAIWRARKKIVGLRCDLAEALGVDRCYVRRVLNLACLPPDIVEAIVAGREPSGLSLERLAKGVPIAWDEQRVRLRHQG